MRGILWRVVVILALAVPASAQQQGVAKGSVETSAGGGVSFPLDRFADNANTGFNVSGRAAYYVTDAIAVGGQIAYNRFGASDELKRLLAEMVAPGENVAVTANFDMLHFAAYGKFLILPEARAVPYVKAQIGWSTVKASGRAGVDEVNCSPSGGGCSSDERWVNDLAMGASLGLDFRFGEIFGAYAEADYNTVFTEDRATQIASIHGGIIIYAN